MLRYAIVEILGRQYKVTPEVQLRVGGLGQDKSYECKKVLLLAQEDKIQIGRPYLKDILKFEILGNLRSKKIRVATYKAKANTRKVRGSSFTLTKIKLQNQKREKS